MEITLEKIELVKDRTGASYKEAKEALEKSEGSVVDAIITIEEAMEENLTKKVGRQGTSVISSVKNLIRKGNVARIVVKKDSEIILNIPVNAGIVTAIIAPIASALAAAAFFGFRCVVEVVNTDGTVVEVSERAREARNAVVEKGSDLIDDVKSKGEGLYDKAKDKVSDAGLDDLKEKGSEIYNAGREKARDIADHAKEKLHRKDDKDISLNIAEDLEKAADVIDEGVSEELNEKKEEESVNEE